MRTRTQSVALLSAAISTGRHPQTAGATSIWTIGTIHQTGAARPVHQEVLATDQPPVPLSVHSLVGGSFPRHCSFPSVSIHPHVWELPIQLSKASMNRTTGQTSPWQVPPTPPVLLTWGFARNPDCVTHAAPPIDAKSTFLFVVTMDPFFPPLPVLMLFFFLLFFPALPSASPAPTLPKSLDSCS